MTKMLLRFVHEFRDRHGKVRRYFRRPGFKRVALPGLPGSDEFMEAYKAALDPKHRLEIGASRTKPGTVGDLVARYLKSAEFLSLASSSQATYRGIVERFRVDHGDKRVAMLRRDHVRDMMAKRAETPAAANNFLKTLRILMTLAIDAGMRGDDPTTGVKRVRIKSDGHPVWTANDIEAFRRKHPLGSRARLAMELALNTMQRRGDLVKLGRQHIQGGTLTLRQGKTGTVVEIPVLPELQAALDMLPADQLTFLMTDFGKAFAPAGFGNWFRRMAVEAKLPKGYNVHGLRKSGATRLADAGCSDHEIMSWGGWKSLSEVQRYTRTANRRKLAAGVVRKLETGTPSGKPN